MHALVLMTAGPDGVPDELQGGHEEFIGELEKANKVVLGGGFPGAFPYYGAYLLSCRSLDEAREVATSDPYVLGGAIRCDVVEWELVAVNPAAVDRSALRYP